MNARRSFLARAALLVGAASGSAALGQSPANRFDVVIKGGQVIDPSRDIHGRADIGIRAGRIAAIEPDIAPERGARVIDASGKLVTPGLIDMQVHVFPRGSGMAVAADDLVAHSAVTTAVSAGDAGAANFADLRRYIASQRRCRIYAFLHISRMGLSGYPAAEMLDLANADVEAAARAVAENHDIALGVAVRQSASIVGANGFEPLRRAIAAVERAGTRGRVMCHIGGVPGDLAELLDLLRPRDIVTQVYSGAGNAIVRDGKVLAAMVAARRRGVVIDVGHGGDQFDYRIAEPAIQQGLIPDVLSSGIRARRGTAAPLLTAVMSQFLNMGFGLEQVIAMATINPARIIGREPGIGTLALGAPADLSILELVDESVTFSDARKNVREGRRWLQPIRAIRSGVIVGESGPSRKRTGLATP